MRRRFLKVLLHAAAVICLISCSSYFSYRTGSLHYLLVGTMSVLWFDIFNALGVDHATLMDLRKQYPTSPQVCLYNAILMWVEGTVPKPSWKALAGVLNFKMLESDLAKTIALQHFSEEERVEEEAYLKGVYKCVCVLLQRWGLCVSK